MLTEINQTEKENDAYLNYLWNLKKIEYTETDDKTVAARVGEAGTNSNTGVSVCEVALI